MTAATRRPSKPPVLPDPGSGRRWEWELVGTNPMRPRRKAWFATLVSRAETPLGYLGWYEDYGWSATMLTRTKSGRKIVPGAWTSAEAAADSLLRALRDRR